MTFKTTDKVVYAVLLIRLYFILNVFFFSLELEEPGFIAANRRQLGLEGHNSLTPPEVNSSCWALATKDVVNNTTAAARSPTRLASGSNCCFSALVNP